MERSQKEVYYGLLPKYLLGAPGVGRSLATGAPISCVLLSAPMTVMPVPDICAPTACARASGAETVMEMPPGAPPRPLPLPPPAETTTADSIFVPLSMVTAWPGIKPVAPLTGIVVAATTVAAANVVAPC